MRILTIDDMKVYTYIDLHINKKHRKTFYVILDKQEGNYRQRKLLVNWLRFLQKIVYFPLADYEVYEGKRSICYSKEALHKSAFYFTTPGGRAYFFIKKRKD